MPIAPVAAGFKRVYFTCEACGTLCGQKWLEAKYQDPHWVPFEVYRCTCAACKHSSYWMRGGGVHPSFQIYPQASNIPLHQELMPEVCKPDYLEARSIFGPSPRGAAALMRLCIQKLLKELGEKGSNIDSDIASLVRKGLAPEVQQALDICRVVGNNAVHPGEIDLNDTPEIAGQLFMLTNFIVEQMIERPKRIQELFGALPPGARAAIEKRDGAT